MYPYRPSPELIAFAKSRRGIVTSLVISGFLTVTGFVCLLAGIREDRILNAAADAFNAAPICTGTTSPSRTAPPCRLFAPMVVTGGWMRNNPGPHSHDFLTLRAATGETYDVSMGHASRVWHAVSTGQTVQAELWQDNVVAVSAGTVSQVTGDNPGAGVRNFFTWYTGIWWCVFVFMFLHDCRRLGQAE